MISAVKVVSPPSALDTLYARRSVRSYLPAPIDRATVETLLAAAVQAPTAMHEEPWTFAVVQNRATLMRLSDQAKALPAAAGLAPHRDAEDRPIVLEAHLAEDLFHGAGTLIVICGKPMGPFVVADCWLAAANLMLAACALGLGTCVIGSAVQVLNQPDIKAELGIPIHTAAIAPIIVGVPRAGVPGVPAGHRLPPEILAWR